MFTELKLEVLELKAKVRDLEDEIETRKLEEKEKLDLIEVLNKTIERMKFQKY